LRGGFELAIVVVRCDGTGHGTWWFQGHWGSALKAQFFASFCAVRFLIAACFSWLAELCPRCKTVQDIALPQETTRYKGPEGEHYGQSQQCAPLRCLEAFYSISVTRGYRNICGSMVML
jgi:phage FluMu protein Com